MPVRREGDIRGTELAVENSQCLWVKTECKMLFTQLKDNL